MEQIVFSGRSQGKLIAVLQWSADNGVPVCCDDAEERSRLVNLAEYAGIAIPEPVLLESKPKERYGPSILIDAAKAVQNALFIDEMLKYRFKSKGKQAMNNLKKKLYPDGEQT